MERVCFRSTATFAPVRGLFTLARNVLAACIALGCAWFWTGEAARAGNVVAGVDLLVTPSVPSGPDATIVSVNLPAGFFGTGSQAFSGSVTLGGLPLLGNVPPTDTIVVRQSDAVLPGVGSSATIPIEICALSLVSLAPIQVAFQGGSPSSYRVRVCLADVPQPAGSTMTIFETQANGGTFDSTLNVVPRFVFDRVAGTSGVPNASLVSSAVTLSSSAVPWSHVAPALAVTTGNATVDHDCNPGTAMRSCGPTTNFFPVGRFGEAHPQGVRHVAQTATVGAPIPALSPPMLLALALLLAYVGSRLLKRRDMACA